VQERPAGALVRVPAGVEDVAAVADLQAPAGVLLDDHDGHAGGVDVAHARERLVLQLRREAGGRLVEEQHARLHHERAGERDDLPLAARQRPGALPAPLGQQREQLADGGEPLPPPLGAQEEAHAEVVLDRECAEHVARLGHVADAARDQPVGGQRRDVLAGERHRAAPHRHQPEHRLDERRLAGAVRPDHADDLAVVEGQVAAVQDVDAGQVAGDEVVGREQPLGRGLSRGRRHPPALRRHRRPPSRRARRRGTRR
jgi:hypothetical protein